jgi:cold shock CspA family protein
MFNKVDALFCSTIGGQGVFIHITAVHQASLSDLSEGANVTFDLILNHHGKPIADNLQMK